MRLSLVAASGAFALLAGLPPALAQDATAGDAARGRKVARVCSACHGIDGIAKQPDAANLAGQDGGYLVRQLLAFRGGDRKNEVMSLIADGLSDTQIQDVAAYYSAVKIQVVGVPGQ